MAPPDANATFALALDGSRVMEVQLPPEPRRCRCDIEGTATYGSKGFEQVVWRVNVTPNQRVRGQERNDSREGDNDW
jgi:hypothetical protein